jgi:CDP-2,3-bis-(O-geranylgeranyl)-sn-glycerol synthase
LAGQPAPERRRLDSEPFLEGGRSKIVNGWSILQALWLFLPAYVANMSPVFTSKMFPKWNAPIDGGRMAKDGKRMMGDGKTWRGLFGGAIFGGLAAVAVAAISPHWAIMNGWDFGHTAYATGTAIGSDSAAAQFDVCGDCHVTSVGYPMIFLFGAFVGFLALAGDAIESYAKRRTGRPRGAPWFPFDQLDFVVFGLLGMLLGSLFLANGWLMEAMFGDWIILTTIVVGTPALHLSVNRIGYWLKLKDVPW